MYESYRRKNMLNIYSESTSTVQENCTFHATACHGKREEFLKLFLAKHMKGDSSSWRWF